MNHFEYGFFDELQKFANSDSSKVNMGSPNPSVSTTRPRYSAGYNLDENKPMIGRAAMHYMGLIGPKVGVKDTRPGIGGMNKSAEEGKLKKITDDILSSPTGAPETLKDELLDTVLGLGGGFAGSRIGRLVGRDDETGRSIGGNLGALVGGLAGPSMTRAIRYDRKLKEQGRKAKVSRLKAGAITGLLGAALGASIPTGGGDAKQRLIQALALGIPAVGIGAGAPAIFGTTKA